MRTDTVLIHELMFAEDMAFCTYSVPKLQEICNAFSASYNLFGLKISAKKTIMLAINSLPPCI